MYNRFKNVKGKSAGAENPNLFFSEDGTYLGTDTSNNGSIYVLDTPSTFICSDGNLKCIDKDFLAYLKKEGDNPNKYHTGSTDPPVWKLQIPKEKFIALAGTIYAEDATTQLVAKAIYGVLKNRADYLGLTPYQIASSATQGIYGYKERSKILQKTARQDWGKNAYSAVINGIIRFSDPSNGAYVWQGKDFGEPSTSAYKEYYKVGFLFTNPKYDLWGLGSIKSGNSNWDYKYQSTAAEGNTTFMNLTDEWKNYTKYKKAW